MTYDEYVRAQTHTFRSFESEHARWSTGQRAFIDAAAKHLAPGSRVLDAACGDGVGLAHLASLGHIPSGIDLCEEKARRAQLACPTATVYISGLEDLDLTHAFDAVLSSHTLEHVFDPPRALHNLSRALIPGGLLAVALPFVDKGHLDAHYSSNFFRLRQPDPAQVLEVFHLAGFDILHHSEGSPRGEPELQIFMTRP